MQFLENVRKHRYIKFVATKVRRKHLVSGSSNNSKIYSENFLVIEMKKKKKHTHATHKYL